MVFKPKSAMEDDLSQYCIQQGIPFKRNDRTTLGNRQELDFYFPDNGLAIELNGLYQHSEIAGGKDKSYHKAKFDICQSKGIRLLNIWQDEYWRSTPVVYSKVKYMVNRHNDRIHARSCTISSIRNSSIEKPFFDQNHIQGFADYRQKSVVAEHGGLVVGIMCFAWQNGYCDLVRYATDIRSHIPGLFTKMLKFAIKEFEISGKIISFSDNRFSDGNLYEKSGFVLEKILPPGYCYTDNYVTRYNRQNFMKHKLVNKYDLDPADVSDKSEWEIVRDLGFDRLWDCGKKRWRFDV
jgi:hypothetical protein